MSKRKEKKRKHETKHKINKQWNEWYCFTSWCKNLNGNFTAFPWKQSYACGAVKLIRIVFSKFCAETFAISFVEWNKQWCWKGKKGRKKIVLFYWQWLCKHRKYFRLIYLIAVSEERQRKQRKSKNRKENVKRSAKRGKKGNHFSLLSLLSSDKAYFPLEWVDVVHALVWSQNSLSNSFQRKIPKYFFFAKKKKKMFL